MQRFAIVDPNAGKVLTVVEYEAAPSNPPPGFDVGIVAIQSDIVGGDWTWNGTALVPPAAPVVPPFPETVLSQDLMAQFTAADASAIQAAIAANVSFWLLWQALTAQRDPMIVTNARFLAGWNVLVQVLGQARMTAIATALGVTV